MKKFNVAIVGATGVVGQEIMGVLERRCFPISKLLLLASEKSAGSYLQFHDQSIQVEVLTKESFKDIDYALFSAGAAISKEFAPLAVQSGAVVVDNTSFFRMRKDVPLVVPEVNKDALKRHQGIIANPNCSTAQLVLPLKAMHDELGLKRVVVSTYQSVSGAGKEAVLELENQTRANLSGKSMSSDCFTKDIAFNVIPHIDVFLDNGYTKEEMKMIDETKKILNLPDLAITATCVRVPVFVGHSESVNVQTEKDMTVSDLRKLLNQFPGVSVCDDVNNNEYPTPRDLAGRDETFVGRIRKDESQACGFDLWVVSDNLRKGAALNTVQIAESLVELTVLNGC